MMKPLREPEKIRSAVQHRIKKLDEQLNALQAERAMMKAVEMELCEQIEKLRKPKKQKKKAKK